MRSRIRVTTGTLLLICALAATGAASGPSAASQASGTPVPSRTAAAQAPERRLQDIREQLGSRQRQLARTQQRERQVLGELSRTEERLHAAEVKLRRTAAALTGTRHAVADASRALHTVSSQLADHEGLMEERLRAFYKDGPLAYLDVVLGASDFSDLVGRTYLVGVIVNRDLRLFQQVSEERERREEVRTTLAHHEADLQVQQQRWIASRQETAALAAQRRRVLGQVRQQRQTQEAAIRELEMESFRIAEIIRQRQRGTHVGPRLSLMRGSLLWPASGAITSGFGWRVHPIFRTRSLHTGIDIGAPWGAPVEAAADGAVLYVGWMTGYGNVVVLDHGNGISSIYGHLSSYAVHPGDQVHRGQIIAHVGSTGWSTGPHLHFEVRQDGQPVDPLEP